MAHELVIVLDFGGQYNQLIARRVRECNVYCEVKPFTTPLSELKAMNPIGIIFTGGPNSVYLEESPHVDQMCIRDRGWRAVRRPAAGRTPRRWSPEWRI